MSLRSEPISVVLLFQKVIYISRCVMNLVLFMKCMATAAAINIGRSVAWLEEKPREKTRVSWFGRLKHLEL